MFTYGFCNSFVISSISKLAPKTVLNMKKNYYCEFLFSKTIFFEELFGATTTDTHKNIIFPLLVKLTIKSYVGVHIGFFISEAFVCSFFVFLKSIN